MKAIEMLKDEHRLIEKVLGALDNYAAMLDDGKPVDSSDLARFVGFIRTFADSCHHGKEEDILFAELVNRGFPREQGPVAVMLMEHEEGRRLVKILKDLSEKKDPWTEVDRMEISRTANAYSDLLRRHIMKEDNILYPAAIVHIPPEAMEEMYQRFLRFEEEETGPGEHEKFHQLAEKLIQKYSSGTPAHNHTH